MKRKCGFCLRTNKVGALKADSINNVTLGELARNYEDKSNTNEGGVTAWDGRLEVRPKFQRAFVVDGNKNWQSDLLDSVVNGLPIGVIYFGKKDDGTYINIDGQQRLMTLLSFIHNDLSLSRQNEDGSSIEVIFNTLPKDWQDRILNYCPEIKVCTGSEEEMLAWFTRINKPICVLTPQELRNASHNGPFVESIKQYFAKVRSRGAVTALNGQYLDDRNPSPYFYGKWSKGLAPERQEVVELVLDWVSYHEFLNSNDSGTKNIVKEVDKDTRIEYYMSIHRKDNNCSGAKSYYETVIDWVNDVFFHDNKFPKNPREWQNIQSQDWNVIYEKYHDKQLTSDEKEYITNRCAELIGMGAALYNKSNGIYEWVIRGEKDEDIPTFLHLRPFKEDDKSKMYKLQGGDETKGAIDPIDGNRYKLEELHAHHIVSFRSGGLSILDNLVLVSPTSHKRIHDSEFTREKVKELRNAIVKSNGHSLI